MGWHEMDSWDWVWMTTMMVLFWGVVVTVVIVALRRTPEPPARSSEPPEVVLRHRLAAGDIDVTEYRERLDALRK